MATAGDRWTEAGFDASRDEALVRLACEGDQAAFDELIERYQRRACSVSFRLLGDMNDALEVCQEAFIRAYQNLPGLQHQARFGAWLLRIVTNLSLNYRRDRAAGGRRVSFEDCVLEDDASGQQRFEDTSTPEPAAALYAQETDDVVQRAIRALPDHQRMALVLFCIEKLPQRDVAAIMECSVEAVKWHVFQARRKLRQQLEGILER